VAGPTARYVYIDDTGTSYAVRMPVWEAELSDHAGVNLQDGTVATDQPNPPIGFRRRKRYYVITATGREGSFTVLDPVSTINTAANGAAVQVPLFNSAVVANNGTLRGRTGERTRAL
jgi:hypothetical protein